MNTQSVGVLLNTLLVGIILVAPLEAQEAPAGDLTAGAAAWRQKGCYQCHGESGEGGFGPTSVRGED